MKENIISYLQVNIPAERPSLQRRNTQQNLINFPLLPSSDFTNLSQQNITKQYTLYSVLGPPVSTSSERQSMNLNYRRFHSRIRVIFLQSHPYTGDLGNLTERKDVPVHTTEKQKYSSTHFSPRHQLMVSRQLHTPSGSPVTY
jgi:hypothetical protein